MVLLRQVDAPGNHGGEHDNRNEVQRPHGGAIVLCVYTEFVIVAKATEKISKKTNSLCVSRAWRFHGMKYAFVYPQATFEVSPDLLGARGLSNFVAQEFVAQAQDVSRVV
jgi:hypothetical protein